MPLQSPGSYRRLERLRSSGKPYLQEKIQPDYLGGTVIPGEGDGFLWRGKVASVDGFMEGTLNTRNSSTKIKLEGVRINVR